jgi:hypothetical protein
MNIREWLNHKSLYGNRIETDLAKWVLADVSMYYGVGAMSADVVTEMLNSVDCSAGFGPNNGMKYALSVYEVLSLYANDVDRALRESGKQFDSLVSATQFAVGHYARGLALKLAAARRQETNECEMAVV